MWFGRRIRGLRHEGPHRPKNFALEKTGKSRWTTRPRPSRNNPRECHFCHNCRGLVHMSTVWKKYKKIASFFYSSVETLNAVFFSFCTKFGKLIRSLDRGMEGRRGEILFSFQGQSPQKAVRSNSDMPRISFSPFVKKRLFHNWESLNSSCAGILFILLLAVSNWSRSSSWWDNLVEPCICFYLL